MKMIRSSSNWRSSLVDVRFLIATNLLSSSHLQSHTYKHIHNIQRWIIWFASDHHHIILPEFFICWNREKSDTVVDDERYKYKCQEQLLLKLTPTSYAQVCKFTYLWASSCFVDTGHFVGMHLLGILF